MELPFVNPAMLWGSAAIAAPIAIFLLTRFRYKRVPYAAIVFLQRALKKQQRRLRLENLLLLLIRCAIIILLAAALARPRAVSDVVLKTDDAEAFLELAGVLVLFELGHQRRGFRGLLGKFSGQTEFIIELNEEALVEVGETTSNIIELFGL